QCGPWTWGCCVIELLRYVIAGNDFPAAGKGHLAAEQQARLERAFQAVVHRLVGPFQQAGDLADMSPEVGVQVRLDAALAPRRDDQRALVLVSGQRYLVKKQAVA